jgi:hypothetical protein
MAELAEDHQRRGRRAQAGRARPGVTASKPLAVGEKGARLRAFFSVVTDGADAAGRSEAALASVTAQGAGNRRRRGPLLERVEPPALADGLAMDRVLQTLEQRLKLVNSPLQGFDAPLLRCVGRLGSRVRGPPTASQLNNAFEPPQRPRRPPAWIAGT